jgi:hypothetical protein
LVTVSALGIAFLPIAVSFFLAELNGASDGVGGIRSFHQAR